MPTKELKPLRPIKVVSVTKTLDALAINQYSFIKYSDATPSTITTTASRLPGKSFEVTTKEAGHSTKVTRLS